MKTKTFDYLIPLFIAIILAFVYYMYTKPKEHFTASWKDTAFNTNIDEAPPTCDTDNQCDTKKCLGSGFCAI